MNELPLVSIAIPAFNPEYLTRTLISAISQRYPKLEVIVCDDSQGDEIKAIFDEWAGQASCELRYVRNPRTLGFAGNLLACLEQSRGTFIKFLCDDDWLVDGCISQQAQVLIDCPPVSLVVNHRLICAADETLLPARPANCLLSQCNAVIKGGDLLDAIESNVANVFGGISHALMRRAQVQEFLPQLVHEGGGFRARVDFALYICLLSRGHLGYLISMLSLERMHPGRLSNHASMTLAFKTETEWLTQMLTSRSGEPAPASGWLRYLPIEDFRADEEVVWEEFELTRFYAGQIAGFQQQVGTRSMSFNELYEEWLSCRTLSPAQIRLLPKRIEQWPIQPRIAVVVFDSQNDTQALKATLSSIEQQSYAARQVWVLGVGSQQAGVEHVALRGNGFEQLNQRLTQASGIDWIFLLQAGDSLHPHALVIMAERMALQAGRYCLYTDEGSDDGLQASQPIFKPDFNLDLMRTFPYVGRMLAFERSRLLEQGGFASEFDVLAPQDMLWRLVESHGLQAVGHVAELLVQCREGYGQWQADPACVAQASPVLKAHLQRLGVIADVVSAEESMLSRVQYLHNDTPLVSILIAAGQELKALIRCVESIFEHTAYPHYELLLAVTGNEPADVCDWVEAMRGLGSDQLRIVQVDGQGSPTLFNQASEYARGAYLLLTDVGCVFFDKCWLNEMLAQAQRPEVGVVGPKQVSSAGFVVNAGLVLGLHGPVGTPFMGQSAAVSGYMNRLIAVQNLSAVSADCMLVRREIFAELGGLDAQAFAAELFDTDFCLRVRNHGYLVVWTPYALVARLPVRESTKALGEGPDQDTFYERWLPKVVDDPAYNRNLSLKMSSYNLEPGLRSGWDPFTSRILPYVMALPINNTAVGHYRVAQPFTELENAGWIQGQMDYGTPSTIALGRHEPDVIILQCRYMPQSLKDFDRIKRFSNARRIYEIDDYIIDVPKKNAHSRNMPDNMREMVSRGISMCDRVVVSTAPLAEALSSMHHDIRVVPNMLASHLWTGLQSRRQTSVKPRVGWAGGTSHRGDLELIVDVVRELADQVDWVFFGMCPDLLRPYIKEFHSGIALAYYPQKLASLNLDLAVAPLESNLFNDCKSNLRLLEYGACGFPVVCADTKAYQGYLPCTRVIGNSPQAWLEAIRMHLADPKASYRMGDELREVVLRDYVLTQDNLQHWANAWLAD
ncbi:glycosyltransferase [Pseudomonas vranovensis]|uniref:glycosyltransferase n=1 Tax=Pseudomonas vranovensis TaxID=321661 RepID=UPI003D95563A